MDSKTDEYLIANLKYFVQTPSTDGDRTSEPLQLQQSINNKSEEINRLCVGHLPAVLDHYRKYYQLKEQQTVLTEQCSQFNNKIEKMKTLTEYNSQEIQQKAETIRNIDQVLTYAQTIKDFVATARKAVKAIEQEKYTNSIRFINKLKHSPIVKEQSPLNRVFSVFRDKIQEHINRLLNTFSFECQRRYMDIGVSCFNKISHIDREKQNIYQSLFNKNNNRNSVARLSMYTSQLIVEENFRNSIIMRPESKNSKSKFKIAPTFVRIKLEVQQLRQIEFIYNELKEGEKFRTELKEHGRMELVKMDKKSNDNHQQLRSVLTQLIGFLMIRRELNAIFKLDNEMHILANEILVIIRTKCKKLAKESKSQDIVGLRESLTVFLEVLEFLEIPTEQSVVQSLFKELYKLYGSDRREEYDRVLEQNLKLDNQKKYYTYSQEEYQCIRRVINLPDIEQFKEYEFQFTCIIPYCIDVFSAFFTDSLQFLGNKDEEGEIHVQLQKLLLIFLHSFAKYSLYIDNPILICQGLVNINYLEKIFKHFTQKLDLGYEIMRLKQYVYKEVLEKVKVELTLKVREMMEHKVSELMTSYAQLNWMTPDASKTNNQFVEWLFGYIKANTAQISLFKLNLQGQLIYTLVSFINHKLWEILTHQVQSFNLVSIHNLNLDLIYMFTQMNSMFYQYKNLGDKLKEIRQFVDLMLTGNLNDLFDPVKKRIQYSELNLYKVAQVLSKYSRTASKTVRQLKKKDIQLIVKRIQDQRH